MRARTPGSFLVHFTSQSRFLERSATSACLSNLLPASGHTCLPEAAWNPSSAVALHVHPLRSPNLQDPKLCTKVPNSGVAVRATVQKVCFVRREKFSKVLFPQPAWRPHELSPVPTGLPAPLARSSQPNQFLLFQKGHRPLSHARCETLGPVRAGAQTGPRWLASF